MNLDQYKQKIQVYEKFSHVVRDILSAAIFSSENNDGYHYHLQQIQCTRHLLSRTRSTARCQRYSRLSQLLEAALQHSLG